MSDAKWTPGPWSVTGQPNKVCADGYTKNGCAKVVTSTNEASWLGDFEPYANANLIAAAPELYEALYRLMNECIIDGKIDEAGYDCWIHHAQLALAKARGETK